MIHFGKAPGSSQMEGGGLVVWCLGDRTLPSGRLWPLCVTMETIRVQPPAGQEATYIGGTWLSHQPGMWELVFQVCFRERSDLGLQS